MKLAHCSHIKEARKRFRSHTPLQQFIPTIVPVRNNRPYRFFSQRTLFADEPCSPYLILWTVAPVVLCSVCHFYVLPLVSSPFTVPANAYPLSTFALEVAFDWHATAEGERALNPMTGRLSERQPVSCSLPLHAVHSELSRCCAGAHMAKTSVKADQCYQLQHTALSFVALSVHTQCH